jgi:hypothetical protein
MHGSGVGHIKDLTFGLKGGPQSGSPLSEFLPSEFLGFPPSNG